MKITELGTGRWASCNMFLAWQNGHKITAWERIVEGREESELFRTKKNKYVDLSKAKITFTHDLDKAIKTADYVIISILSQNLDELMQKVKRVKGYENKKYCLAMKGVEATTGRTLSEIMIDNGVKKKNIAVMAGPGHVQSIIAGEKTHMTIAAYDTELAKEYKKLLSNKNFKLFITDDVKGTELCAAAKNVYGALAGICVGSGNKTLRGSLMCASIRELEPILDAMGCRAKTASDLPLLGDYDATMYDSNSHNLKYGIEVVKQDTINPKLDFASIEGRYAVEGLIKRMINYNKGVGDRMQLKAPLLTTYEKLLDGKIKPESMFAKIDKAIEDIRNFE